MPAVLIVEDDIDIREIVAEALSDEGYDVRQAANGKEALTQLEHMDDQPCLVLLDLMMPVMNGQEVLKVLHESHRLASLPVVVVSAGDATQADVPEAKRFVRKPPSLDLLLKLVHEFCGP
jgi:two-component system chemotaxis response regulator CheY